MLDSARTYHLSPTPVILRSHGDVSHRRMMMSGVQGANLLTDGYIPDESEHTACGSIFWYGKTANCNPTFQ
jgi:hypothetical protein